MKRHRFARRPAATEWICHRRKESALRRAKALKSMSVARRSWVASRQTAVACRSPNARCPPSLRSTASPSSRVEQADAAEAALHWLLAEEPSLHSNVRDRQHAAGHRSSQILRSSTALLGGVKEAVSAEDFPGFQNSSMDHSDKFARGAYTKPHKKVSGSLPPPPSMPPPGCGLVWLEKQNFTAAVHGCTPRWWCPPRWCPPAS